MRPLYIFDLDGTLALTEHRQHLLDNRDDPDRWRKFFAACVNDEPNPAVLATMHMLRNIADVEIWSGRSSEVRQQTVAWLCQYGALLTHEAEAMLRMRDEGDFTPDEVLKGQWLSDMNADDRIRLIAVFDDRDKVVAMWRAAGVPCFQVAPGSF